MLQRKNIFFHTKIPILILTILSLTGCPTPTIVNESNNKRIIKDDSITTDTTSIANLRDTISALLKNFNTSKDSSMLHSALTINEEIIHSDQGTMNDYLKQIKMLKQFDLNNEAFDLEGIMLDKYKSNSIEKIIYNGIRCKLLNRKDSMNFFFNKALSECDKQLVTRTNNKEYSINKIRIYAYTNKKSDAWSVVNDIYEKSPNDQFWKKFILSFDDEYKKIQEEYKNVVLVKTKTKTKKR